jgi:hypothetical protein
MIIKHCEVFSYFSMIIFSNVKLVLIFHDYWKQCEVDSYFSMIIGLHQGSALSPYLLDLVMDVVTRDI